jgi:UDP-N-acetylmuramate: L-alanyl-gamma-D-glutamyl-meso-diaminopimelate ligase
MPKDYFKVSEISRIADLSPGAHIHLIGVCGVAMGQLALALKGMGFYVSGSDKEFYEPMGSLLRNSKIKLFEGYAATNIEPSTKLVIIGNAISYENPEVSSVESNKTPYSCFPQALFECLISKKHSIVVAGTHGKSTTTGLIAHLFNANSKSPSFFVGGVLGNSDSSFKIGTGATAIVEGDEYDSAFFAKVPKFSFYKPNTFIINAIEFDHADIYPSLAAIDQEFINQINQLNTDDTLISCSDHEHIAEVIKKSNPKCTQLTFGCNATADMQILKREPKETSQIISLKYKELSFEIELPLPGVYNARNLAVAALVGLQQGLSPSEIAAAARTYNSVRRRFDIRLRTNDFVIIEDFAHHPTAIAEAIKATRESFPNMKICAVFEPRSNTSRRAVFHQQYLDAFKQANQVILCSVKAKENETQLELLDTSKLCQDLSAQGIAAEALASADEIYKKILSQNNHGTALLVMSNGSFGGILAKLTTSAGAIPNS